jgi:tetratricopeptide (TPR) repeat protein
MEPVAAASLAANIVQFVEFGARVIKRLYDFRESQGDVPEIFRGIGVRLGLLVESLKNCSADGLPKETERALSRVLTSCHARVGRLEKILTDILPSQQDSWLTRNRKALISIGKDKEVHIIDTELGRCIEILTLHHVLPRPARALQKVDSGSSSSVGEKKSCCLFYGVPRRQVSRFVGRNGVLHEIEEKFKNSAVVVVRGMGGQGKTQLALEYCRRSRNSNLYAGIIWVDATSERQLRRDFEMIAEMIKPTGRIFASADESIAFAKQQLHASLSPWLVVLDNHDDPKGFPNVMDFLPADGGHVLLTTRHSDVGRYGIALELTGMTEDQSVDLFFSRVNIGDRGEHEEQAREIVRRLGYHPLAIDQAGAYFNKRTSTMKPADFLRHYEQRRKEILSSVPQVWEYRRREAGSNQEVALSVYTTWLLSYERLLQESEFGKEYSQLLLLLGFFHHSDISDVSFTAFWESRRQTDELPSWMRSFLEESRNVWRHDRFEDGLVELRDYSLIQGHYRDHDGVVHASLHPLIKDWIQIWCNDDMRYEMSILQAQMVEAQLQLTEPDAYPWYPIEGTQTLSSHIAVMEDNYRENVQHRLRPEDLDKFINIARTIACFLDTRGRFQDAEKWLRWALDLVPESTRASHPESLQMMSSLGAILKRQNRCAEANELYQQVENICLRHRLHDSIERISNMWYKAALFSYAGEHEQAKKLHLEVATRASIHLGPRHDLTVRNLFALAAVLQVRGEHQAAAEIYYDLDVLRLRHLPRDHHMVLYLQAALAHVLRNLGQFKEAEGLHRRVRSAWINKRTPELPWTVKNICDLGYVMFELGSYAEADQLFRCALAVQEKLFGEDNPASLLALNRLSLTLVYLGKPQEGLQFAERAVKVLQRTDAGEHLVTLAAFKSHGFALNACGRHADAEHVLRRCMFEREIGLGKNNFLTLGARHDLAIVLRDTGRTREAMDMFCSTWMARQEVLGKAHPHTILSAVEYALLLDRISSMEQAKDILHNSQTTLKIALNEAHPVHGEITQALADIDKLEKERHGASNL